MRLLSISSKTLKIGKIRKAKLDEASYEDKGEICKEQLLRTDSDKFQNWLIEPFWTKNPGIKGMSHRPAKQIFLETLDYYKNFGYLKQTHWEEACGFQVLNMALQEASGHSS